MKRNDLSKNGKRIRLAFLLVTVLAALLLVSHTRQIPTPAAGAAEMTEPAPAFQTLGRPWTGVGSTGAVDESALNIFAFGTTDLGFKPTVQGNVITARYNVTNVYDNNANPNIPGWTTFEMGSIAPANTIIEGRLFQVRACTQEPVLICMARNKGNDQQCARCQFGNTAVNFTNNLYYVEVKLDRSGAPAAMPRLFTLRVY